MDHFKMNDLFKMMYRLVWSVNCCLHFIDHLFSANLTGYTEKVGMENFELLKVLGTGGEKVHTLIKLQYIKPIKCHFAQLGCSNK